MQEITAKIGKKMTLGSHPTETNEMDEMEIYFW